MKRTTTLTTAILLPIITSLAAYIVLFSYSSGPPYFFSINRENDSKTLSIIRERKKITKIPVHNKSFDEATLESFFHKSLH